jgi:putative transposase
MRRRSSLHDLVSAVTQLREEVRRYKRELGNLQNENEILREAAEPLIHQAAARERFAFIRTRRDRFSVKLLCRVLATDGGNYRAWARAQEQRRAHEYDEQRLAELIFEVHAVHPAYGVQRVTREL